MVDQKRRALGHSPAHAKADSTRDFCTQTAQGALRRICGTRACRVARGAFELRRLNEVTGRFERQGAKKDPLRHLGKMARWVSTE